MKRRLSSIPLRVNILTVFILITTVLSGVVVLHNYYLNRETALLSARELMDEVDTSVTERIMLLFDPAFMLVETVSAIPDVNIPPSPNGGHPLRDMMIESLRRNPNIRALFMGYDNGDFFMVYRIDDNMEEVRKGIGAPEGTRFVLRIDFGDEASGQSGLVFLSEDCRRLGFKPEERGTYDPRKREWYRLASATDSAIITDVYRFALSGEHGNTVARRFEGAGGVFGADMTVQAISAFLREHGFVDDGVLFVFSRDGRLHAHPDPLLVVGNRSSDNAPPLIGELGDPLLQAVYKEFVDAGARPFERKVFFLNGRAWMADVDALPAGYGNGHLAVVAPMDAFIGPIIISGKRSFLVSVLTLLLCIPVIIWVAYRISRPLGLLSGEVRRIRDFHLEGDADVTSRITEVRDLAMAVEAMKGTLRTFGKYVPRALVEKMIRQGIEPRLGGERRELTILFSDVAGFTSMAESMDPEEVTRTVSEYFQVVGREIESREGAIDKYIGDAVMAFWNAPTPDPDHARKGCLAVLGCWHVLRGYNRERERAGLPPLRTRFGLHLGEVVVGNVGSPDRMDYTAMGAAVNSASRLEGLNKYFGTSILVSRNVADRAGPDFLYRCVGTVVPKGATAPMRILELVGMLPGQAGESGLPEAAPADVEYCRKWDLAYETFFSGRFDRAVALFRELAAERPDDQAAAICLGKAEKLRDDPPESWNGVEEFFVK